AEVSHIEMKADVSPGAARRDSVADRGRTEGLPQAAPLQAPTTVESRQTKSATARGRLDDAKNVQASPIIRDSTAIAVPARPPLRRIRSISTTSMSRRA